MRSEAIGGGGRGVNRAERPRTPTSWSHNSRAAPPVFFILLGSAAVSNGRDSTRGAWGLAGCRGPSRRRGLGRRSGVLAEPLPHVLSPPAADRSASRPCRHWEYFSSATGGDKEGVAGHAGALQGGAAAAHSGVYLDDETAVAAGLALLAELGGGEPGGWGAEGGKQRKRGCSGLPWLCRAMNSRGFSVITGRTSTTFGRRSALRRSPPFAASIGRMRVVEARMHLAAPGKKGRREGAVGSTRGSGRSRMGGASVMTGTSWS